MSDPVDRRIRRTLATHLAPVDSKTTLESISRKRSELVRDRRMPLVSAAGALVILLIAFGLVVTGRGGATGPADPAVLAASQERMASAGSARMSMVQTMNTSGAGQDLKTVTEAEGIVDLTDGRSRMTMKLDMGNMPGGFQPPAQDCEILSDGGTTFWRIPADRAAEFGGRTWIRQDMGTIIPGMSSGPVPVDTGATMLGNLRDVQAQGRDKVRGVRTTRYSGRYDVPKMLEQVPEEFRDQVQTSLEASPSGGPEIQVWIDDEGLIRRQRMLFEVSMEGFSSQSVTTVEMYDFGVDLDLQPPGPDEYVDADARRANGLLVCMGMPDPTGMTGSP